jgi:GWxTD domain-containing protein
MRGPGDRRRVGVMPLEGPRRRRIAFLVIMCVVAGLVGASLRAAPAKEKISKQEKRRRKAAQKEMESAYKKWLSDEVPYIITGEERTAFKQLSTDDEREQFVEQFWERRNPNPGSPENEFKEEYYRRIAYANEHYASGIPGWRTDRGRIYIMYGPPDEIESHPSRRRRWRDFDLPLRAVAVSVH